MHGRFFVHDRKAAHHGGEPTTRSMEVSDVSVLDRFRLDHQVAMITGAASGIGRAFAEAMAELGAAVALVDVDENKARDVARQLEKDHSCKTLVLRADVTRADEVEAAVARVVSELGDLDVAFANAGIAETAAPIADYRDDEWHKVLAVNLTGVYLTDKAAAKHMIQKRKGRIINTASIYGLVADFGLGAIGYTAAKGGVVNLTRTLAVQLAPFNVRVNAIAPAFIKTNIGGGWLANEEESPETKQVREEIIRRTPLGRLGEPDDLKGMAAYLASDASSYCTGYVYAVDGGWLAW